MSQGYPETWNMNLSAPPVHVSLFTFSLCRFTYDASRMTKEPSPLRGEGRVRGLQRIAIGSFRFHVSGQPETLNLKHET